jgi:hypothetical protein
MPFVACLPIWGFPLQQQMIAQTPVSHIAAALAKSKGKQVATPPSGTPTAPAVVAPPAATARPALQAAVVAAAAAAAPPVVATAPPKKKLPAWTRNGIFVGALVIAGLGRWWFYRAVESPPPAPVASQPAPPPNPTTAPKTGGAAPVPVASGVGPVSTSPIAPTEVANPPSEPQSGDFTDAVAKLPITASRQGARPAVMIGGKLYRPGEAVTDDLTVQSVEPDRVLFHDAVGRIYERRF